LQLTAAKSLAQLGNADVIRTLYWSAGSDRAMERLQANAGLKALSGRSLKDFEGYDPHEGAFISAGIEARGMLAPIEDAEKKAKRFAAVAAFCRWLKAEKPSLWAELDPNVRHEAERHQRKGTGSQEDPFADPARRTAGT
jgi:hypothetical protein